MINFYSITFKQDVKKYMPFFRVLLNYHHVTLTPNSVKYPPQMISVMNGETFINRLALVTFEGVQGEQVYSLKSQGEERWVYSGQFSNDNVKAHHSGIPLFRIPSNFSCELAIQFTKGNGLENVRYSNIEGYRFDDKTNEVKFELNGQKIDQTLEGLKSSL